MITPSLLGTVNRAEGAVRLERIVPAPPDQVWETLTDPARLSAWLAPVQSGRPAPGGRFVLRMNDEETATCTVTAWDPPHELGLEWDYTGEGPSVLTFRLIETAGQTRITVEHTRIPADAVQYGAGWHVHVDCLARHLDGVDGTVTGCDGDEFLAAYRELEPLYDAAATG